MSDSDTKDTFVGMLAIPVGILFFSFFAWYLLPVFVCQATYPVPVKCFLGSIVGMALTVCMIPAGIFDWITQFLFGGETWQTNTVVLGVIFVSMLMYVFRKPLFEKATIAASYTVSQPDPKPDIKKVKRAAEYVQKETKRQDGRTEMEEAIREMEEAKARVDELRKNDQSS